MKDWNRMLAWVAISAIFYAAALTFVDPVLQTLALKLGNVTLAGNVGYWLSRTALGRVYQESSAQEKVARAIIMGAAMIAVALGM